MKNATWSKYSTYTISLWGRFEYHFKFENSGLSFSKCSSSPSQFINRWFVESLNDTYFLFSYFECTMSLNPSFKPQNILFFLQYSTSMGLLLFKNNIKIFPFLLAFISIVYETIQVLHFYYFGLIIKQQHKKIDDTIRNWKILRFSIRYEPIQRKM